MKVDCHRFVQAAILAASLALLPGAAAAGDVDVSAETGALPVLPEGAVAVPAPVFSFSAENVPMKQALAMFARANRLNIVPDLDIEGLVTVEFADLPLDLAMRALLEANGYYFVDDDGLLRVRNRESRLFHIDYINATRAGQGLSAVQISSGAGGAGGGGGGGGSSQEQGSTMTVTAGGTVNFWGDLTEQLRGMISEGGAVTVNSLAGSVLVTDSHRTVETVATYLESIRESVVRQVDLEVEIYEVAFSDAFQLGIDWSRVGSGLTTTFETGLIVRSPAYGADPLPAGIQGSYQSRREHITGVIEALAQQGNLKVVSKPRLRTLNNQPAVVRVGQDLPVFIRQSMASTGDNPVITENITIQTVTVGTVLSITPQISPDGLITLDLSPAVSRLVRMDSTGPGPSETSAPVIDIRQASSIVRLRDGDTVVMGGLVQEGKSTTVRKIPILGDIPLLGKLFSGESTSSERTELVFLLTPRVVNDRQAEAARPPSATASQAAAVSAE